MDQLLTEFKLKGLTLQNKAVMSPMCMYSAQDGYPNDFHFTHYTSRAIGGMGLIIMEMTNVAPNGRISDGCLGLWSDDHIPHFKRIVDSVHQYGTKIGIQIAHAGRKAEDADDVVSSSDIKYEGDKYKAPRSLSTDEVKNMVVKYKEAAERAVKAGFDTIEIHAAHGYLIHQFQSPKTNNRTDQYGEDRLLFGAEIIEAVKSVIPEDMPLIVRISAKEYSKDGYDIDYGVEIAKRYKKAGADIIDVSGGGNGPVVEERRPRLHPGYQVHLAREIKVQAEIPVIAVGMLDDPRVADHVVGVQDADLIAIGRASLRDPHWVLNAGRKEERACFVPKQYVRGYQ